MLTRHSQINSSMHRFDATGLTNAKTKMSALEDHAMRDFILDLRAKGSKKMFKALEVLR